MPDTSVQAAPPGAAATNGPFRPLALPYETESGRYIYDANTNRILLVSADVFRVVTAAVAEKGLSLDENVDEAVAGEIRDLQRGNLLRTERPPTLRVDAERARLERLIGNELSQLILETTEGCNLRCRYCVYGGHYSRQRTHGTRPMSREVLEAALAYFYSHNEFSNVISVGFYGGEPLSAFDVVREGTALAMQFKRGPETALHLTTNGTLLTPEKFDFLIDHQFNLLVSLDGPREAHDRYRVTRGGEGTYRTIMRNLSALQSYDPDYYEQMVMFSVVRVPSTSLERVVSFFASHPLLRGHSVQMALVSGGAPALDRRLNAEVTDPGASRAEGLRLLQEYVTRLRHRRMRSSRYRILQGMFGTDFISLHRRRVCAGPGTPVGWHGMCVPASRKLYVGADGRLFVCERAGRGRPIGDVTRGVDVDRVLEYLKEHERLLETRCRECWAQRLCGACQATIGDALQEDAAPGELDRFCAGQRSRWARNLLLYTRMAERDAGVFDFIEDISVG